MRPCCRAVYYEVERFIPTAPQPPEAGREPNPPAGQMPKPFLSSFVNSRATD